ncbi:MAG: ABC transporter substrate-binding protein [Alphaproteobacteria bacterium]|nr:ABC transporter substrate-binding protein [Alphaproteobacteria bacterium]
MIRRTLLAVLTAVGLVAGQPADAKTKLTFAYVADPTHELYFHAIRSGRVTSDLIDLEITTISIPALTQAMLGRQYDIIQASVVAVPRAVAQGLNVKILHTAIGRLSPGPTLDLWVKKDSPAKSIHDLKGKQIGVFGLGSTALALMRVALAKQYGFNSALQGGDFQFVELPTTAIPGALASDRIAAGALLYAQVFEAERTGDFRSVWSAAPDLLRLSGARMVLPVIVGFTERVEANPALYREFNRVVTASVRDAAANKMEWSQMVGQKNNVPPEYLRKILDSVSDFKTPVEEADVKAIDYFWTAAVSIGLLPSAPPVQSVIWPDAMKP